MAFSSSHLCSCTAWQASLASEAHDLPKPLAILASPCSAGGQGSLHIGQGNLGMWSVCAARPPLDQGQARARLWLVTLKGALGKPGSTVEAP